jgi:hypothetical protein
MLKAMISHSGDNPRPDLDCGDLTNSVKRSLYIEKVLYTISDRFVKMNDLTNFAELGAISIGG